MPTPTRPLAVRRLAPDSSTQAFPIFCQVYAYGLHRNSHNFTGNLYHCLSCIYLTYVTSDKYQLSLVDPRDGIVL